MKECSCHIYPPCGYCTGEDIPHMTDEEIAGEVDMGAVERLTEMLVEDGRSGALIAELMRRRLDLLQTATSRPIEQSFDPLDLGFALESTDDYGRRTWVRAEWRIEEGGMTKLVPTIDVYIDVYFEGGHFYRGGMPASAVEGYLLLRLLGMQELQPEYIAYVEACRRLVPGGSSPRIVPTRNHEIERARYIDALMREINEIAKDYYEGRELALPLHCASIRQRIYKAIDQALP